MPTLAAEEEDPTRILNLVDAAVLGLFRLAMNWTEKQMGELLNLRTTSNGNSVSAETVISRSENGKTGTSSRKLIRLMQLAEKYGWNYNRYRGLLMLFYLQGTKIGDHDVTISHAIRVSEFAQAVGRKLKIDRVERLDITIGALFHDIGKLWIPEYILTKIGKPNEEEWEELKRHPEFSEAILRGFLGQGAAAAKFALLHHVTLDGSKGYPEMLRGTDIPRAARIITICDIYEAWTAVRSYKKKIWKPMEAIQDLRQLAAKNEVDAGLVEVLATVVQSRIEAEEVRQKEQQTLEEPAASVVVPLRLDRATYDRIAAAAASDPEQLSVGKFIKRTLMSIFVAESAEPL